MYDVIFVGGAAAGLSAYHYVQDLKGKPASRADWKALLD